MTPSTCDRTGAASLVLALAALTALSCSSAHSMPRVVFNASDSVPRGWYAISAADRVRVGDTMLVRLPDEIRALAAERGYLPIGVPLLKTVAAIAGQRVCIRHGDVYVDDSWRARVLVRDGKGRPLHASTICRTLVDGEVFLLATHDPASFDSRYFGPVDRSFIRGRATPWHVASHDEASASQRDLRQVVLPR